MRQQIAWAGVVATLSVTVALAGCTARTDRQPTTATTSSGGPTTPAEITTAAGPAASDPAMALLAATDEPLSAEILPSGFSFVDSVDADGPTSNVYCGPDGPEGPALYLYTDIPADYTNQREAVLTWVPQPGFGDPYAVSIARSSDGWTFLDIDAPHDVSVQLIGHRMTEDEVVATAHRLLDSLDAPAR